MAKIKVGVIGVGIMGAYHVKTYSTLKEAALVGVFDVNQSLSNDISLAYKCKSFPSLESILDNVDAFSVAVPTSAHYQICLTCLNRKKHLLIEKPLAASFSEGQEIVSLATAKKCVLAVGMIERFNPAFIKAFSLVKHEKILGLSFKRFSPFPSRIADASVVFDMMLHDLDLALCLSQNQVSSVKAQGQILRTDKLDEASAILYFKNGLIAKLDASRVKDEKLRLISITTDKYIYEVDLLNKKLYSRSFDSLSIRQQIEVKSDDQLSAELRNFLLAIDRSRPPLVSGSEALISLKLAEEVEKLAC